MSKVVTKTVYLVYHDSDYGAREEWNTFYLTPEIFEKKEDAEEREKWLKENLPKGWYTDLQEAQMLSGNPETLSMRAQEAKDEQEALALEDY